MTITEAELSEIIQNMELHDKNCPDHYYHIKTILRNQRKLITAYRLQAEVIKELKEYIEKLWISEQVIMNCKIDDLLSKLTGGRE